MALTIKNRPCSRFSTVMCALTVGVGVGIAVLLPHGDVREPFFVLVAALMSTIGALALGLGTAAALATEHILGRTGENYRRSNAVMSIVTAALVSGAVTMVPLMTYRVVNPVLYVAIFALSSAVVMWVCRYRHSFARA